MFKNILRRTGVAWVITLLSSVSVLAQEPHQELQSEGHLDTLLGKTYPVKILHAEPLYIDLIRDLGARKGEREWNVGAGMTDRLDYTNYEFLVEYEWAPIDRLGLEIELPVSLYSSGRGRRFPDRTPGVSDPDGSGSAIVNARPANRLESLKLAAQYTFLVSEPLKTSLAIGGITELEFYDLNRLGREGIFEGVLFNPFFIGAKVWGNHFHTLLYTGPRIFTSFGGERPTVGYEINSNFHYMIPGSRNFVGLEVNQLFDERGRMDMVLRPQMRVVIHEGLMIGIVPGIPVNWERERLSSFMRLIYEPREFRESRHHKPRI